MFVDFLCTYVSSLLPHLVMFMPAKEIVSCSAVSIVKFKFSWQEFNLSRKALALLRDSKADVSSVSPSSERIKELWVVCGLYTEGQELRYWLVPGNVKNNRRN